MRSSIQSLITVENQTFDTRNFSLLEKKEGIFRSYSKGNGLFSHPSINWTDSKQTHTMPTIDASRQFRSQS